MLDQFRTLSSGIAAKLLLAFLVLTFAVWGIGDMVRHPPGRTTIATVGGEDISAREFEQALRREAEKLQESLGTQYSPEMLKQMRLPQHVVRQLVDQRLIQLESQSAGLIPGDAAIAGRIFSNPAFQNNKGKFDRARFEAVLRNNGVSEKDYVSQLRQDIASNLLLDTLSTITPDVDEATHTLYAAAGEQREATFYHLTPQLITGIPAPPDAEINSYYAAHKAQFTVPEYRQVSYVTFTAANLPGKPQAVPEDELRQMYSEHINEFRTPEEREVQQLLFDSQEKADKAEALLKAGKTPAQAAAKIPVVNKGDLSLGRVGKDGIIGTAGDKVFALQAGQFTAPIQSPFGWHIFLVSKIYPPGTASFEEAKPRLIKEAEQQDADDRIDQFANKLQDALAGGSTLAETAHDLGLTLKTAGPFDREGKTSAGAKADIPDLDKFIETAFSTDEKTQSSLMTSKNSTYYLLQDDAITASHVRPLAEVKAQVIAGWQQDEREKKLAALAGDIAKKFAAPATRAAAIAQYRLTPEAATIRRSSHTAGSITLPPELADGIFAAKPDAATNAFPLADGSWALAVAGKNIPAPPPNAAALEGIRQKLQDTVRNELMDQYAGYLARKYSVSVNTSALQNIQP